MSEAQEVTSEVAAQPPGVGNEVTQEVPSADNGAQAAPESVDVGSQIVEQIASDRERDNFARNFQNLARQEARFQKEKQDFRQEKGNLTQKAGGLDDLREVARTDPMQALEALGLSYDGLTRRLLNEGKIPLEDKLAQQAQEIENLKKYNQENAQERESRVAEREQKAIYGEMVDQIQNLVDNNDKYELIKANGAYNTVYQVIQDQFNKDGSILQFDQAADYVERYFSDEAERYYKSAKLRDRYKEHWHQPVTAQDEEPSQQAAVQQRPNTLSNDLTSQTPARSGALLPKEESLARAAAIMRGEI